MSAFYNEAWDYVDLVIAGAMAATALFLGQIIF